MAIFVMRDGTRKASVTVLLPIKVWKRAKACKIPWSETFTEAVEAKVQAIEQAGSQSDTASVKSGNHGRREA